MKRQWIALFLTVCLLCTFVGCGRRNENSDNAPASKGATVRYLNFKPESASAYQEIASAYEKETGKKVIVETAANNTYEQTLSAKMATSESPTIFHVNGPRGYANWKRYCADLKGIALYEHLTDKNLALTAADGVYGIPNVVEGYGIIYNQAITDRYFALATRDTTLSSMADVTNFDMLKLLVEDMQAHKDELGIRGVFASTSLKPGEDWRWQTHLMNIPVYYEFEAKNVDLSGNGTQNIGFDYADQFRNIFDLYIHNSVSDPKTLGTKIVDESMSEFALGQCAMVQNGNWAWSQIAAVEGNTVAAENIKYLPIYTGMEGEENQGLCIGTENYLCINSKASKEEQQAAADFLYWLFTSNTGKSFVINKLNYIAPFDTFSEQERPDDPLAKEVIRYMEMENVKTIPWQFTLFPSQTFKDDFGAALLQYAQGKKTFDEVKSLVVTRWKEESALL